MDQNELTCLIVFLPPKLSKNKFLSDIYFVAVKIQRYLTSFGGNLKNLDFHLYGNNKNKNSLKSFKSNHQLFRVYFKNIIIALC